jgi:parvulin-like peptidyl-prolyl isomerase
MQKNYKLIIINLITIVLFSAALATSSARAEVVDAIAAVVNGQVITRQNIDAAITTRTKLNKNDPNVQAQMLDYLIEEAILESLAKGLRVVVDEAAVDSAIANIRRGTGLDMFGFVQALERKGTTWEAYFASIRGEMLRSQVFGRSMREALRPDDKRLRKYYLQNSDKFRKPGKVRLSHLLLASGTGEARLITKKVNEGVSFNSAALDVSGQTPLDTGFMDEEGLSELFKGAVAVTRKGALSPVIPSVDGDHLLLVADRTLGVLPSFEESREEVMKKFTRSGERELYRNWMEEQKRKATIERME